MIILSNFDLNGQSSIQYMDIGTIIKEARLKKGISQKTLASLIGVDVSFLCKIEKNEKKLSLEKLQLIANILNLDFRKYKNEYYYDKVNSIFQSECDEFKFMIINDILSKRDV